MTPTHQPLSRYRFVNEVLLVRLILRCPWLRRKEGAFGPSNGARAAGKLRWRPRPDLGLHSQTFLFASVVDQTEPLLWAS